MYSFWYLYTTNGTDGFLLDLVRRPTEAIARLVTWRQGEPPQIVRHGFAAESVNGVPGALGVTLGGIALDALGCRSALPGMNLDARFALDGRHMRFVPGFVTWWFDAVPDFRSSYGTLDRAICEGATYEATPVTCSTYSLESLVNARWLLISAPRFPETDLAFEISAGRILGRWMPAAWVYYGGRQYRVILGTRIERPGEVDGGERIFTATIRTRDLRIDIAARAPLEQFARLDTEGNTDIHTTLFGTCQAHVASTGKTFVAARTCLLEVKN